MRRRSALAQRGHSLVGAALELGRRPPWLLGPVRARTWSGVQARARGCPGRAPSGRRSVTALTGARRASLPSASRGREALRWRALAAVIAVSARARARRQAVRRARRRAGSARRPPRPAWTRRSSRTRWTTARRRRRSRCASTGTAAWWARTALAPVNRNQTFESWSMAKSVTAMMFGRAMTLGADLAGRPGRRRWCPRPTRPTARSRMRDLLTMTSGLRWNGLRDYNIFTMPDRVSDALTLAPVKPPGTYFEYAQSAVALLAEAIGARGRRGPAGVRPARGARPARHPPRAWRWTRDRAGHIAGFMGVNMRPDDFGRLGELMRRGGVWRGQRLLSEEFMRARRHAVATNGCYGWLIWVNAGKPCVGAAHRGARRSPTSATCPTCPPTCTASPGCSASSSPSSRRRASCVVRTGQDPGLVTSPAAQSWEHELYERVLGVGHRPEDRPGRRRRPTSTADRPLERRHRLPERAAPSPTGTSRARSRTRCRPPGRGARAPPSSRSPARAPIARASYASG